MHWCTILANCLPKTSSIGRVWCIESTKTHRDCWLWEKQNLHSVIWANNSMITAFTADIGHWSGANPNRKMVPSEVTYHVTPQIAEDQNVMRKKKKASWPSLITKPSNPIISPPWFNANWKLVEPIKSGPIFRVSSTPCSPMNYTVEWRCERGLLCLNSNPLLRTVSN